MEKIRSWIIRHRDQTCVSYSRFGRPGEEEDDRPLPSTIIVASFNENSPEFLFFNYCHIQKAAVALSCFGMSMVVLFFLSAFFEFDWYNHERGVDISALSGLFIYLLLGILVHYYVLYGVKKNAPYYLLPFIIVYSIACTGELFLCLGLIFKMLESSSNMYSGSIQVNPSYSSIFVVTSTSVIVQAIMLSTILRCRQYISLKKSHELELKVAEKSRKKNPSIQIVIGDINNSNNSSTLAGVTTITNGNGNAVNANGVDPSNH